MNPILYISFHCSHCKKEWHVKGTNNDMTIIEIALVRVEAINHVTEHIYQKVGQHGQN